MADRYQDEDKLHETGLDDFHALERMREQVDWDVFVPHLDEIFGRPGSRNYIFSDRPAWDTLVMYRAMLLGVMYSLDIPRLYFLLLDSTSFQRFAGFEGIEHVPDRETLALFRDRLEQSRRADELFEIFKTQLLECGYEFNEGRMGATKLVKQLPDYPIFNLKFDVNETN